MNWSQALVTILLGNTIVLIPILLNSHPGTKYGIPFPVFARAAYGTLGSNVPALMRALVACGWFGIQAWIGGEALQMFFKTVIPGWPTLLGAGFAGHTDDRVAVVPAVLGTQRLHHLSRHGSAPRGRELGGAVRAGDDRRAAVVGGVEGATASARCSRSRASSTPSREFWPVFVPSLTAMIGFWATLSLNMPDFTRFGRSQREQIIGQVVALPTTMSLFAAMGVMITSATAIIYGQAIWDPVQLVGKLQLAGRRRDLDVHRRGRDDRRQHRGQRRVAGQRFRQRVSALHQLQDRRPDHRPARHRDSAVAAARRSVGLHLHLAARLLRRPRLDCRRAGRRLLDRAAPRAAASRISISPTASTAAGTCARSPRRRSAARWRGAASSSRR